MSQLYEHIDTLNSPYEAFRVDSRNKNDPPRPHWHYYAELLFVEAGSLRIESNERTAVLNEGDFAFLHAQVIHNVVPDARAPFRYGVIKFDLSRLTGSRNFTPNLRAVAEQARRSPQASYIFPADTIDGALFSRVFDTCIRELSDRRYGSDLMVYASLCELMVCLARLWQSQGIHAGADRATGSEGIDSIVEYIDEHSAEPLLVENLARRCGMSYSNFALKFKQMYGRSCKEYIELVRVSKAENLLLFTDADLTGISMETGFADCSHLIKVFKKWKGVTPKQYKLQSRQQ